MTVIPGPLHHTLRSVAMVFVLAAVAAWPFHAVWGWGGIVALAAAGAVALVGLFAGRLPRLFLAQIPDAEFHTAMAAVGVRLLVTLALTLAVVLATGVVPVPFLGALAVFYVVLLVLEVRDLLVCAHEAYLHEPRETADCAEAEGAASR